MFKSNVNQSQNEEPESIIETTKELDTNWDIVESSLAEGAYSGYKTAIIEMEKIFRETVGSKKMKWYENEEDLPQNIAIKIMELEKLKYARRIYFKILHLRGFNPTYFETRNAVEGYFLAIEDLKNFKPSLSATKAEVELFARNALGILVKILIFSALFSGVVVLFSDSTVGQSIFIKFLNISRFVVYKITLYVAITVLVFVVTIFILKIVKKIKRKMRK